MAAKSPKPKSKRQIEHESLIQFLRHLNPEQFSELDIRKHILYAEDVAKGTEVTQWETLKAGVLLAMFFNTYSGSAGEHNFYKLLECYLLDKEKRAQINKIIKWS